MLARALTGLAFAALVALPAQAVDIGASFKINRIRAATPSCYGHGGGWVGRVSGRVGWGTEGGRITGFEGCFDDRASCTAWRVRVVGAIDGRVIYNTCEPR